MARWKVIENTSLREINLDLSFRSGQIFTWKQTDKSEWTGVINRHIVSLKQAEDGKVSYALRNAAANAKSASADHVLPTLTSFLQLSTPLAPLYKKWSKLDENFKRVAPSFPGLRVFQQDPVECVFSFICSSNNNVKRIALMVDRLRQNYGVEVGSFQSETYYAFPTLQSLAKAKEDDLRALGLGYRAKFITTSASQIMSKGGEEWLQSLRQEKDNSIVRSQLTELNGVGAKVADCIALFSLCQPGTVPVDVHVWRITCRDYRPDLAERKSLTDKVYSSVGDFWRER
mmetsp:Transcript_40736/g.105725  ORF Transcript_40736/g.105725 Transcript_40736/m.105725 type:complete len:287 (-) Transcript_40736:3837-4697(-)